MKVTEIVRRISDLGRVVIPKEIRRTMRIREGDPLLTTLTLLDRFSVAIHSVAQRIKSPPFDGEIFICIMCSFQLNDIDQSAYLSILLHKLEIKLFDFFNTCCSGVTGAASIIKSGLRKEVDILYFNDFLEV